MKDFSEVYNILAKEIHYMPNEKREYIRKMAIILQDSFSKDKDFLETKDKRNIFGEEILKIILDPFSVAHFLMNDFIEGINNDSYLKHSYVCNISMPVYDRLANTDFNNFNKCFEIMTNVFNNLFYLN